MKMFVAVFFAILCAALVIGAFLFANSELSTWQRSETAIYTKYKLDKLGLDRLRASMAETGDPTGSGKEVLDVQGPRLQQEAAGLASALKKKPFFGLNGYEQKLLNEAEKESK